MAGEFIDAARDDARGCFDSAAEDIGEEYDEFIMTEAIAAFLCLNQCSEKIVSRLFAPLLVKAAHEFHDRREHVVRLVSDLLGHLRAESISGTRAHFLGDRRGFGHFDAQEVDDREEGEACRELRPRFEFALVVPGAKQVMSMASNSFTESVD